MRVLFVATSLAGIVACGGSEANRPAAHVRPTEGVAAVTGPRPLAATPPSPANAPESSSRAELRLEPRPAPVAEPPPHVEIKFPIVGQRVVIKKARAYRPKLLVERWPLAKNGDGVEVVLDDGPVRRATSLDGLALADLVAEDRELTPGEHRLVAAAVRENGEIVRMSRVGSRAPWAAVHFFVGEPPAGARRTDAPELVLFRPRGTLNGAVAADTAFVDFLPLGIELAGAKNRIVVRIEGEGRRAEAELVAWRPVAIHGLPSGDFRVTVSLSSETAASSSEPRARAERTITVNRDAPVHKPR